MAENEKVQHHNTPEADELITQLLRLVHRIQDTQERIRVIAYTQAKLALALYSQIDRP